MGYAFGKALAGSPGRRAGEKARMCSAYRGAVVCFEPALAAPLQAEER